MSTNKVKVAVFCPLNAIEKVQKAIGDLGAGTIGNYSHCSFVSVGRWFWLPLEWAHPAIWAVGKLESAEEGRLEFLCTKDILPEVIAAMKAAHPYEEVAYDVFALLDV